MISIVTDYVPPVREQRQSSTHMSYYEARTASRTRQSVGSETQHIVLNSKGNPFFLNKSGNTIIIVEYPFVMMLDALTYLNYFSLTIQVREEYHEVIPGQAEVFFEAIPVPSSRGTSYGSIVQTRSQTTRKTDLLSVCNLPTTEISG